MEYEIGVGASQTTKQFVDALHRYGDRSREDCILRVAVFSELNNSNGRVGFPELVGFISSALEKKYNKDNGQELFRIYKPCYRHAYENARLLRKNRINSKKSPGIQKINVDDEDGISFTEFRIFTVLLCVYAATFDIFSSVSIKDTGKTQKNEDGNNIQITLNDFLEKYEAARGHGFAISNDLSSVEKATKLFRIIDNKNSGVIIFSVWLRFIKKEEVRQRTDLGYLFSGSSRRIKPASISISSSGSIGASTLTSGFTSRSSRTLQTSHSSTRILRSRNGVKIENMITPRRSNSSMRPRTSSSSKKRSVARISHEKKNNFTGKAEMISNLDELSSKPVVLVGDYEPQLSMRRGSSSTRVRNNSGRIQQRGERKMLENYRINNPKEEVPKITDELLPRAISKARRTSERASSISDLASVQSSKSILSVSTRQTGDLLGISVSYLRTSFLEEIKFEGLNPSKATIYDIEDLDGPNGVIRKKGEQIKCPLDGRKGASYVHSVSGEGNIGSADFALIHSTRNSVENIISSLVDFCETKHLEVKDTFIWLSCLCTNQHRYAEDRRNRNHIDIVDADALLRFTLTGIRNVLVLIDPWNRPQCLDQAWCLLAIYTAKVNDCNISVIVPSKDREKMMNSIRLKKEGDGRFKTLRNIDVEQSKSCLEWDASSIVLLVKKNFGLKHFHAEITAVLKAWVKNQLFIQIYTAAKASPSVTSDVQYAQICYGAGIIFREFEEWDLSARYCDLALSILEFNETKPLQTIAALHYSIGEASFSKGKYEKSLESHMKALEIRKEIDGKISGERATSYMEAFAMHVIERDAVVQFQNFYSEKKEER